jgi:hypothetical protein
MNSGFMDPLHLSIAIGPLAAYLMLLGIINLRGRPFLTSGGRDTVALGLGIAGLVIAGPMELFLPERAAVQYGGLVWILLFGLYLMCVILVSLVSRPKLVIYNATPDMLRPILAQLATQLDRDARWAGDTVALPNLTVQFTIETFPGTRNVQLVSAGPGQNYVSWRRFESAVAAQLRDIPSAMNPYGGVLIAIAFVMFIVIGLRVGESGAQLVQELNHLLRLR